jgi:predicted HTH domain antitoxin
MGRAAGMCGMHKADFMDELSRRKVSAINWDDQEIAREFGSGTA